MSAGACQAIEDAHPASRDHQIKVLPAKVSAAVHDLHDQRLSRKLTIVAGAPSALLPIAIHCGIEECELEALAAGRVGCGKGEHLTILGEGRAIQARVRCSRPGPTTSADGLQIGISIVRLGSIR